MSRKKKKLPIRSIVVALIVLGSVAYFISLCLNSLGQEYLEDGWKTAQGTILSPDTTLKGKKNIDRKAQGIDQVINYEYVIGEGSYRSNSVSKNVFVNGEDFPEGKEVRVYYNPNDVTDSVLVRSKVQKQYLYTMIAFCIVVIFVVFYSLIKDFRNA